MSRMGQRRKIEILQHTADLPSEFNHSVRPFGIWPITGGLIIAMLAAGNCLTSLTKLDEHLWSLTTQLLEAVKFMHDHNVAHMDLKPANILIPSTYGRLTIVDFGLLSGSGIKHNFFRVMQEQRDILHLRSEKPNSVQFVPTCGQ